MVREILTNAPNNFTPEQVTELVDSRVSEDKYEKVRDQFGKITGKLKERVDKVIEKFETPAEVKKVKDKAKKSAGDEKAEKAAKKLKKKKKK